MRGAGRATKEARHGLRPRARLRRRHSDTRWWGEAVAAVASEEVLLHRLQRIVDTVGAAHLDASKGICVYPGAGPAV